MFFDGHNGYVSATYALYFISIAAIVGGVLLHRKRTKKKIAQLNSLLQDQKDDAASKEE